MGIEKKKQVVPLPYPYYYIPVLVIALAGLAVSIYLAVSHYRVHADPGYSSFCAITRALNCDTVSSSPYAVFLDVPVALWGVIGYGIILFVLIVAGGRKADKKRLWPALFWISLIYSISSILLAGISSFLIHSYCIMCIITYLVNFSLLYYAWFINKRFGDAGLFKGLAGDIRFCRNLKKVFVPAIAGVMLISGGLITGMPEYWHVDPPPLNKSIPHGVTEEGHPWIGAENPELVIQEFTDYLCTQCRIKHFYLRRLIAKNPEKIRLVHRHFPMDHKFNPLVKEPYHMGSGMLSIFAIYAQKQDKFWNANDYFFQINKSLKAINSRTIADKLGLNPQNLVNARYDSSIIHKLQKDLETGLKLGLTGTPGYVIEDKVFQGYIPPRILEKIIR